MAVSRKTWQALAAGVATATFGVTVYAVVEGANIVFVICIVIGAFSSGLCLAEGLPWGRADP